MSEAHFPSTSPPAQPCSSGFLRRSSRQADAALVFHLKCSSLAHQDSTVWCDALLQIGMLDPPMQFHLHHESLSLNMEPGHMRRRRCTPLVNLVAWQLVLVPLLQSRLSGNLNVLPIIAFLLQIQTSRFEIWISHHDQNTCHIPHCFWQGLVAHNTPSRRSQLLADSIQPAGHILQQRVGIGHGSDQGLAQRQSNCGPLRVHRNMMTCMSRAMLRPTFPR